ncbi:MAG: hypothetical protein AAGE94_00320 [Acidobacteriota bacterium]
MNRAASIIVGLGALAASVVIAASPSSPSDAVVVGTAIAVEPTPMAWTGTRWIRTLREPGAAFLKLDLDRVDLPPGATLSVLDGIGRTIETITGRGPGDAGRFWSLAVPGDRLQLVYNPPRATSRSTPPFRVVRILAGDADVFDALRPIARPSDRKSVCAPADFEDAICYQADAAKWAAIRTTAGVLAMVGDTMIACTGVLVSPRDGVLTTSTCLPDAAACANAEFVFGHYRTGCNDGSPADPWTSYRCAETLAASPFTSCDPSAGNLDFTLHRADGGPSVTWGWSDPDPTPLTSGEALYIPQHASGRPLEIVHGSGADVEVDGMTLRYYGTLDTESTSVGAPIFRDADDRLVGLHHCGGCASPGIGNRGVRMQEIDPQIASHLCADTLTLEPVAGSLSQWAGNGDAFLDPGEVWSLVPTVLNAACTTATTGVEATFAVAAGSAPITLLDTVSTFGDLAGGERADGSPIRFRVDSATACAGSAVIDWSSISSAGGPFAGADDYASMALGDVPRTPLLDEDFATASGTTPPAGWAVDDGGTGMGEEGSTWVFDDPGDRQLLDPPFAIVDSEFLGPGFTMDESLRPPTIDASAFTGLLLRFRHDFRWFDGNQVEQADVDVRSTATGGVWTTVATFTGADTSGPVEIDLSATVAADVEIRFRYADAEWEWWWALDDVEVLGDNGPVCQPVLFADGFEAGNTSAWSVP